MKPTSIALLAAGLLVSPVALAYPDVAPLSDDHKKIVWGVPDDPIPKVLHAQLKENTGRHYLKGDEWGLHVYYPALKDLGGAYMGVGTDQAYLFIGWMKPEIAWLTDYDPWVVALHEAYEIFFAEADNADDFVKLWHKDSAKTSEALLEAKSQGAPRQELMLRVFRYARGWIHARLRRQKRVLVREKVPGFLNDADQYTFVRNMVASKRVRPLAANLLDTTSVKAIGAASRKLGIPVRALYLSNAEGYWPYNDQYKANMAALHFDDKSLVIRTVVAKISKNGDYRYNQQPALNYQQWLKRPWVKRVRQMLLSRPRVTGPHHYPLTVTDADPDVIKAKRDGSKE